MELRKDLYEFVVPPSGGKVRLSPEGRITNFVSDKSKSEV